MKSLLLVLFLLAATSCNEEALKSFLIENGKFRIDLFMQVLAAEEGNVFFSPLGIAFHLSFLHFGAKSSTFDEFHNVLHIPNNHSEFESAVHYLRNSLKKKEHFKCLGFKKVYVKDGFPIKDEFLSAANKVFGASASAENIEFLKPEAADLINQWVNQHTENQIFHVVDQSEFDSHTRLLLLSTLYFKANWLQLFPASNTHQRDFQVSQSKSSKVDSMELVIYCNYSESSELDAKVVALELEGGDVNLVIVLPNQRDGLKNLEAVSEPFGLIRNFNRTRLRLVLPKFQIKSSIKLKPILKNLGIVSAFSEDADFSGISGNPGDLLVQNVVHNAFIKVDENGANGVEAVASSYVSVGVSSSALENTNPIKDFIVDHPFLFYVKASGAVLFAGRVVDPNQIENNL